MAQHCGRLTSHPPTSSFTCQGEHHILFIAGAGKGGQPGVGRQYVIARMNGMKEFADDHGMTNWRFMLMPGHEHEFSAEYFSEIRDWANQIGVSK